VTYGLCTSAWNDGLVVPSPPAATTVSGRGASRSRARTAAMSSSVLYPVTSSPASSAGLLQRPPRRRRESPPDEGLEKPSRVQSAQFPRCMDEEDSVRVCALLSNTSSSPLIAPPNRPKECNLCPSAAAHRRSLLRRPCRTSSKTLDGLPQLRRTVDKLPHACAARQTLRHLHVSSQVNPSRDQLCSRRGDEDDRRLGEGARPLPTLPAVHRRGAAHPATAAMPSSASRWPRRGRTGPPPASRLPPPSPLWSPRCHNSRF